VTGFNARHKSKALSNTHRRELIDQPRDKEPSDSLCLVKRDHTAARLLDIPTKALGFFGVYALAASQGQGLNEFDRGGLFSLDFCAEKSG